MVAYLFAEYAGSQPFIRWFVETLALIASIYLYLNDLHDNFTINVAKCQCFLKIILEIDVF